MTDADLRARGQRAQLCDEFIGPILADTKQGYLTRMADLAVSELNPTKRAEKITALAVALKVLSNLENGLNNAIEAGRIAERNLIQAEEIERLGRTQRRIFDIVPY